MSFTTPSLGLGPRFGGYFGVMSFALLSLRHLEFVYECQFNALSRDSYYTSLSDWLISFEIKGDKSGRIVKPLRNPAGGNFTGGSAAR